MTAAYDAQSALGAFNGDQSFTHTPVGTPRGVIVLIVNVLDSSDVVAGVTYDGLALARQSFIADAVGEACTAYSYFLGSGIPTGAKSVAIDMTGATTATAWCITVTATGNTQVAAKGTQSGDQANPSITLATVAGFAGFCCAALASGQNNPASIAAGANYTALTEKTDLGNNSCCAERSDTRTGANVIANFTVLSEDVAMVALAINEVPALYAETNFAAAIA